MTSTIRTVCPNPPCGEVQLGVRAITLMVDPPSGGGSYAFHCPTCGRLQEKPANERIVELLVLAGVEPTVRSARDLPPLTLDDLLAFHELLAGDDWLEDLLRHEKPAA